MKCPFCSSHNSEVLESRAVDEGVAVRRRRECSKCGKRFTTYEQIKGTALWVIKKGGGRELFDKEKIKRGIVRSIQKRPVSLTLVEDLVNQVESEMLRKESEEVTSKAIGRSILKRLKKIDQVAWLRFASVYLEFEDLDDFAKAIKN